MPIDEAIVDACNESERRSGFRTMLDEHLATPFETRSVGATVTANRVDMKDEGIVAIYQRGRSRLAIRILDLPIPNPWPGGAD